MVRSSRVVLLVASAGGNCVDKISSECLMEHIPKEVHEEACTSDNKKHFCIWSAGTCLDKPSSTCLNWLHNEEACTSENLRQLCTWVGGTCLDKVSSECLMEHIPKEVHEEACTSENKRQLCSWFANTSVAGEQEQEQDAPVVCGGDYACPQGRQAKAADTVCAGETCTHDDCCDAPVVCGGDYACPQGRQAKASDTVCADGTCTDDICCDAPADCLSCNCNSHNNGQYFDCQLGDACSMFCVKCNSQAQFVGQSCPVEDGEQQEQEQDAPVVCGGDYACPQGRQAKAADTVCAGETCTHDDCCDAPVVCGDYACPQGREAKATDTVWAEDGTSTKEPIVCTDGTCTDDECCEPILTCGHFAWGLWGGHVCPQGRQDKAADTVCAGETCTQDDCCDAPVEDGEQQEQEQEPVTCGADYTCDHGWHLKENEATVCPGGTCTQAICCEKIPDDDAGHCVDKISSECMNMHEEACTSEQKSQLCMWAGGTCLDKPSPRCMNMPEEACTSEQKYQLCMWAGVTCLDKPSSECMNMPEEACTSEQKNQLCSWFASDDEVTADDACVAAISVSAAVTVSAAMVIFN